MSEIYNVALDMSTAIENIDTTIPCGFIINELVTNSIKRAFRDDRKGEIRIELRSGNNGRYEASGQICTLIVGDNGLGSQEFGFPKDRNIWFAIRMYFDRSAYGGNRA
ncbi:MAG TPA: hypothetical protein VI935_03900 [Thermodesulfobacteriota bacterium]|nr:hypothetical protein [Thermodesulfobacteriota bacterium]